jgi:hypothetical protein
METEQELLISLAACLQYSQCPSMQRKCEGGRPCTVFVPERDRRTPFWERQTPSLACPEDSRPGWADPRAQRIER